MSFHSPLFALVFLPVALGVTYLTRRDLSPRVSLVWLLAASLVFYAVPAPGALPLLVASIGFNFWCGRYLHRMSAIPAAAGRALLVLILGLAVDIGLLVGAKMAMTSGAGFLTFGTAAAAAIPLAISFYTIHQAVFLLDAYRGDTGDIDAIEYASFVTFFPQLIAGPLTRYTELVDQLRRETRRADPADLAIGLAAFSVGLAKKVAIADRLGPFADGVFSAAAAGDPLTLAESWAAACAYAFQIYFDFSGYSDMAVGVARMFGVKLPLNFASPYRSTSLIQFWRTWHITLSRLFFEFVYFPAATALRTPLASYLALLLTMLVCGVWHGAAWTFVIWGAIHGVGLAVNHGFQRWRRARRSEAAAPSLAAELTAGALTFVFVVLAWVWFRATSTSAALSVLSAMFGLDVVSASLPHFGPPLRPGANGLVYLGLAAVVTWLCPDTRELIPEIEPISTHETRWWQWRPSMGWGVALAAVTLASFLLTFSRRPTFLYFQF